MTFPLRSDQRELAESVLREFRNGFRTVLAQAVTGFGKTHFSVFFILEELKAGRPVLFVAHLDALVEDTAARLRACGVRVGIVQAGREADPDARVQVASLQTLYARGIRPPADFIIVDECHRIMAAGARAIIADYPRARVLGLTATPQRGDGQPLGDVFEAMVCGPSLRWLTEQGHLAPYDLIAPPAPIDGALAMDPVDAWYEYTPSQRVIVFAKNVAHADDVTTRFKRRGVPAECVTGETSRVVRRGLRERLLDGTTRALVSVDVFLEGFDAPWIESVSLARSFGVCGSFLQAIGRGLRPSPSTGKARCTVLDLCGSVHVHGLPCDDRVWSLEGEATRRTGESLLPLRRCPNCLAIFRPATRCPRCGFSAVSAPQLPRVLTRAEKMERINKLPQHERDRRYLESLMRVAQGRMRLPPNAAERWALAKFKKQKGREPERSAA